MNVFKSRAICRRNLGRLSFACGVMALVVGPISTARAQFNVPVECGGGGSGSYAGDLTSPAPGFLYLVNNANGISTIDISFQYSIANYFDEFSSGGIKIAKLDGLAIQSNGRFTGSRASTSNGSILTVEGQMSVLTTRCEWSGTYSIKISDTQTLHGTFSGQTGDYPGGIGNLANGGCGTGASCAPSGLATMMAIMAGIRGLHLVQLRRRKK